MTKLEISAIVTDGSLWIYLDNALIVQNTEAASIDVEEGHEYVVHWFVRGKPGSTYTISISSPREAVMHITKAMASGKSFGGFEFKT